MMKKALLFTVCSLIAVGIVGYIFRDNLVQASGPPLLQVSTKAPDFSLRDHAGKEHQLSDLAGSTVVLEWLNPDCPFVKRHYQDKTMHTLAAKFGEKGVKWFSVNSTHYMDAEKNSEWVKANKINWPVLVDQSGQVGKLYGAKTTPHMFIIDKAGNLVYQGAIDNDVYGEQKKEGRTNYVAEALALLLDGKPISQSETKPYGCSVKYKD